MDRRLRIDLPIILLLAKKDYVTKLKKTVIKELIFNYMYNVHICIYF